MLRNAYLVFSLIRNAWERLFGIFAYFALILLILALKKKKFDFFPKYKQIWGVVFRKTTLFFSRN